MACTKIYRLAFEIYQNVPLEGTVHAKAQRSAKRKGGSKTRTRQHHLTRLCVFASLCAFA